MGKKNIRLESFRYRVLDYCSKFDGDARSADGQVWEELIDSLSFEIHEKIFFILINGSKLEELVVPVAELKFYQRGDSELAGIKQRDMQKGASCDAFWSHNNKVITRLVNQLASSTGFSDNIREIL